MDSTSRASTSPAIAAIAAASAIAWKGWPPGMSLIAMSVTMSHDPPHPAVTSSMAWPPSAWKNPRGASSDLSSEVKPRDAASAA